MARARGSYPRCRGFESPSRYYLLSPEDNTKYIYTLTIDAEDRDVCVDDEDDSLFRSELPETVDESADEGAELDAEE